MNHLRTDLPLLPNQEMDDWVEDIVENTHYRDIGTLHLKLTEAIESHDGDMTHATITKKCNKCDRTYPELTDTCECGNTNLESFKVNYNTA
jgi:hypothetical protein